MEVDDRITAFGNQLAQAHAWLLDQLAELREHPSADLPAHCLAFCTAVDRHHTSEDADAFPALATEFPDLAPVLEQLQHDHQMVAKILRKAEQLADRLRTDPTKKDRLQGEIDGLAAVLESHFRYEEKRITAALNSLHVPEWTGTRPMFLRAQDDDRSSTAAP